MKPDNLITTAVDVNALMTAWATAFANAPEAPEWFDGVFEAEPVPEAPTALIVQFEKDWGTILTGKLRSWIQFPYSDLVSRGETALQIEALRSFELQWQRWREIRESTQSRNTEGKAKAEFFQWRHTYANECVRRLSESTNEILKWHTLINVSSSETLPATQSFASHQKAPQSASSDSR